MYMYIHIYAHVYIICIYSYNSFFVLVFNFIKYEFKSIILNYDNIGKSIIMKYYTVYNLLRPMFFTKLYTNPNSNEHMYSPKDAYKNVHCL